MPLIALATIATIIASQSIITGAFSMTRQAIQLGWLPRLYIKQTSSEGYGQIYVGVVNWLLMIVTVGLTIVFGKSDNLAAAYGIAVSATMLMTSALLFIAMREIWGWSVLAAGFVAGCFLVVDSAFFLANLTKIRRGRLCAAAARTADLWRDVDLAPWRGRGLAAHARGTDPGRRIHGADQGRQNSARAGHRGVPDARPNSGTPPVMVWHVKHNRALHEHLFVLRVEITSVPCAIIRRPHHDRGGRAELLARATRIFGFMERPHIPELLAASQIARLHGRSRRRHLLCRA